MRRRDHIVVHGSLALLLALLGPPVGAPTSEPLPPVIPTSSTELPRWTEAPAPAPPPPEPKVPFDGGGALATGSIMLVAAVATGTFTLTTAPDRLGEGFLGAGLLAAGGVGVLVVGVMTRKKFRATELGQVKGGPTTGRAMQAGSAIAISVGSLGLLTGILMFNLPGYCSGCLEPPSEALVLMGVGPGLMTAGTVMFIISQVNRTKYRKWMKDRATRVQPSFAFGPSALQIGVSGRF